MVRAAIVAGILATATGFAGLRWLGSQPSETLNVAAAAPSEEAPAAIEVEPAADPSSDEATDRSAEALERAFREAVLEELARTERTDTEAGEELRDPEARRGETLEAKLRERVDDPEQVDWTYLADVFAGRVSGIPNEKKAGLSLAEIDALGEIPYVEELRDEGRTRELEDLELPTETASAELAGVRGCQRVGPCRRDPRLCGPNLVRPVCTVF